MCGRPLGFKSFDENSDAWVDCDHVSGLSTRRMTAGPDGIRDPVPNNQAASKATGPSGFFGSSVRPIRHLFQLSHPGTDARLRR